MSKRNYNDYDYRESLMDRIKVNKRANIPNNSFKYNNYNKNNNVINTKDNLYFSIDKKLKIPKNKIPPSLNKKNVKKIPDQKTNNITRHTKRETFKKTINTYSNENHIKDINILEELQNNKYLKPMLGASNINNKLLKCQIEEPMKNICTLSLKNYIANNIEFALEKCKSPQKNISDLSNENKINFYNLNNMNINERFNTNINFIFSPKNEIINYGTNKNNNSFIYNEAPYQINKDMIKFTDNDIKKYLVTNVDKMKKKKPFFSEERKDKDNNIINNTNKNDINKIYYRNYIITSPNNNSLKNKKMNINGNFFGNNNNLENKQGNNSNNNNLLLIYKNKLVEEFIIILNKLFSKRLNKYKNYFLNNIIDFNSKSQSKNKIYFKKKNKYFKKKLTLNQQINEIQNQNLIFDLYRDKEKNKTKLTTDTSTNFNLNNKSFSNEKKTFSLSNNFLSNLYVNTTNKFNNQNSSFLYSEQKHKNYSQSPDDSSLKNVPKNKIKTKTIIYKKQNSGSISRSPIRAKDNFVYKKKNLINDNIYINKINNFDVNSFYSNNNYNNKYINTITNNQKGKIIGIDINLGKPVNIINDHSPLDELIIDNNQPLLFKLNTISSKFMNKNKNKKKTKAKSGSKNKIKPPTRSKRFAEEDESENLLFENYEKDESYKAHSTIKKYKENNLINAILENNFKCNKKDIEKDIKKTNIENNELIIEDDKLFIRINSFTFDKNNKKNKCKNKKSYIYLDIEKCKSFSLVKTKKRKKNEAKNQEIKKISSNIDKKKKKNVYKLYDNCTKFFIKILNRLIKKKIFFLIYKKKSRNLKKK